MKLLLPIPCPKGLLLAGAVASAFVFGALPGHAAQLFDDTFESGSANANGWYFYNNASAGTSWDLPSAPSGATLLSGKVLRNNLGSAQNTVALKPFSEFTFNAVGDSISASLSFRTNGQAATGTLSAFGFYDLTNVVTANSFGGTNIAAASAGYTFVMSLANDSKAQVRGVTGASPALATATTTASIGDGVDHTLTFTMTLTNDGLVISDSIDGSPYVSYTDTSITATSGFSVNALKLGVNGTVSYFDNIIVTTTAPIPEAGTTWFAVVATGAAAMLLVRRHVKRRVMQSRV